LDIDAGDDGESMGQLVKDLGNLRELREISIDISRMDRRMQPDLVRSLGNLDKMQYLHVAGASKSTNDGAWNHVGLLGRGLRQLVFHGMLYCEVPSRIDPLRLPNLSHLHLEVFELGDQGLKVLGGLPELCFLNMPVDSGTATLTGSTAAAHGYFRKLRCLLLPLTQRSTLRPTTRRRRRSRVFHSQSGMEAMTTLRPLVREGSTATAE
jgi:hypothetical protein